jgi:hypothetical protein
MVRFDIKPTYITTDVQVIIYYNLTLNVSEVIADSMVVNFNTMPASSNFYVVGTYFRPIYPGVTPTCKVGNQVVYGSIVNSTCILVESVMRFSRTSLLTCRSSVPTSNTICIWHIPSFCISE